jgi:tRNA G18 (ribose-2'-O)-methylase SpoU
MDCAGRGNAKFGQETMAQRSSEDSKMRGYFGIGAERISKPLNLGNLIRSAHAFGASFVFTIGAHPRALDFSSDTSKSFGRIPYYHWASVDDIQLPRDCRLVGIEMIEEAEDLPSFRHPAKAAYVLGPELGSLSPELLARCDHLIRIPTQFSVNVAMAGAIVMYDRIRTLGRFAPRPLSLGRSRRQQH